MCTCHTLQTGVLRSTWFVLSLVWGGWSEIKYTCRTKAVAKCAFMCYCPISPLWLLCNSATGCRREKTGAISISNTFTYIAIINQSSYCWKQTVLKIYLPACCSPVSFGSTLLRYFSNIVVSFLRTSLAWLQQKYRANVRYTSQSNRRKVYRLSSG